LHLFPLNILAAIVKKTSFLWFWNFFSEIEGYLPGSAPVYCAILFAITVPNLEYFVI